MKTIKRIMLMVLAAVMMIGIVPAQAMAAVQTPTMTMSKKDLVMDYPYPAGFRRPTVYTGEFTYWVTTSQTPKSGSIDGFRTPEDEAALNEARRSGDPAATMRELFATGRMAAISKTCRIAYTRDDTREALSRGMTYIPVKANAVGALGYDSSLGVAFGQDDDVIRNMVIGTENGNMNSYIGTDVFRRSALETVLFDAGWDSEGIYTVTNKETGSSYDWTWAEWNGLCFGREELIIESGAFADCKNLVTVWFEHEPARLYIGETAFTGCPNLTIYAPSGGTIEAHCKANGIKFQAIDADGNIADSKTEPSQPDEPVTTPFVDVPATEYYARPVAWAVENGITVGTSETTFSPNDTCTQAQILTFLWRANGCPEPYKTMWLWWDNEYWAKAYKWGAQKSLYLALVVDDPCTRADVVTYLWKLAGKPTPGTSCSFTDVPASLTDAVSWAVEQGITVGTSATTFSPDDTCTRGQIVTFLYRAYGG